MLLTKYSMRESPPASAALWPLLPEGRRKKQQTGWVLRESRNEERERGNEKREHGTNFVITHHHHVLHGTNDFHDDDEEEEDLPSADDDAARAARPRRKQKGHYQLTTMEQV